MDVDGSEVVTRQPARNSSVARIAKVFISTSYSAEVGHEAKVRR